MLNLQETAEYKEWVGDDLEYTDSDGNKGVLVLERDINKPLEGYAVPMISIVKRGDTYRVYRTFDMMNGTASVSVDLSDVTAEQVFEALLDKYSQKRN